MLNNRVAVVTGSSSGIGLGIARALAAEGTAVMLNGLEAPDEAEGLREKLADEFGVEVAYSSANMTEPEQVAELVESAVARLGSVDILVNNAGIQYTAPLEKFPTDRWDAIIAVNLSSAFHTIRTALPHMRARNWGRIINVASTHGLVASVEKGAYVASKHAVVGLTKVVALETAETDITCNAICPGWVLTPLVQKQVDARAEREGVSVEEARARLLAEKQPSKRFVTPEQLGRLAAFLCSDAAAQITGAIMPVDGGWTAQ